MVTKEKLLHEQAYHALLGGSMGARNTYPFYEICSMLVLTKKEWAKLKLELNLMEHEIKQIEDYLNDTTHNIVKEKSE